MYKNRHKLDLEIKLYTFRFATQTLETKIIDNITDWSQGLFVIFAMR